MSDSVEYMNNPSVAVALNTGEDITFTNSLIKPELKEGELYAGILLGKNGSADQHIILLPGDNDEVDHADSTAWAESIGGELPTRREQSLLFANLKEEFQHDWYWSCETHAAYAGFAWCQGFDDGQGNYRKYGKLRARAVRRVPVIHTLDQPTIDYAAGMMKAAEIVAKHETDWDLAYEEILSAIPKESADALKEYVRGKCALDIKTIHHIALNPLDCDIAHRDEDSLTVKLVKNMAYLIRKDGK